MKKQKNTNQELIQRMDEQAKTQHSKEAIFVFLIFGTLLFILNKEPVNPIKAFFLFYLLGIFLISFLSIPSYIVKMAISKRIDEKQAGSLSSFYWILEIAYDCVATYLLFLGYMEFFG